MVSRIFAVTVLCAVFIWGITAPAYAETALQKDKGKEKQKEKETRPVVTLPFSPRVRTVEVWGGIGHPLNHASFKRYWMRGPAAGFAMYFPASDRVRIGFGMEATLFSFRTGNFQIWNPDVTPQVKDVGLLNVFLSMRRYFTPTLRTSPYIGCEVGFTRVTGAEYKVIINAVRVTYYEVQDAFRLTGTINAGVDHYFTRKFAVQGEGRLTYLHNAENISLLIGARVGVKFTL